MKYLFNQLKVSLDDKRSLATIVAAKLHTAQSSFSISILKKSIDARKSDIFYIYNLLIDSKKELHHRSLQSFKEIEPLLVPIWPHKDRPVIVGFGPAGMFSGLVLARSGAKPLIVEKGKNVEDRLDDIEKLRSKTIFSDTSNICFGEGGAGMFSDGKLYTGVNDKNTKFILEEFVKHGAPLSILYDANPHIGSDILPSICKGIREEIESLGGEILFDSEMVGVDPCGLVVRSSGEEHIIRTSHILLAIGHSAPDLLEKLIEQGLKVEPRDFSIGVRIEHLQADINKARYHGFEQKFDLPSGNYKVFEHLPNNRTVYSFCMCPGGEVINSSTEPDSIVTNGMSRSGRNGVNGNAAILVNVKVEDFYKGDPLDGFRYRKELEEKAFRKDLPYYAPAQKVSDFLAGKPTNAFGRILPTYLPGVYGADLNEFLPSYISESLKLAILKFKERLPFFADGDAILTGFETRSSSPVRIPRDEHGESSIKGLYPIGEGASYAGGITSSALDGVKIALAILTKN